MSNQFSKKSANIFFICNLLTPSIPKIIGYWNTSQFSSLDKAFFFFNQKWINIFSYFSIKKLCCGYSLEVPQ